MQLQKSTEQNAAALNNIASSLNNIPEDIREGWQLIAEKLNNNSRE